MCLLDLPVEIFNTVIESLVAHVGIFKAVRLRLVNSMSPSKSPCSHLSNTCLGSFDSAIVSAICIGQVVDIQDPAIPGLYSWVPAPLKGRILLAQSGSEEATSKDKAIAVIAHVNQSLDQLTRLGGEQRRMVSEAMAHLDGYKLAQLNKYGPEIDD